MIDLLAVLATPEAANAQCMKAPRRPRVNGRRGAAALVSLHPDRRRPCRTRHPRVLFVGDLAPGQAALLGSDVLMPHQGIAAYRPFAWTRDDRALLFVGDADREFSAIGRLDIAARSVAGLYEPKWDVSAATISFDGSRIADRGGDERGRILPPPPVRHLRDGSGTGAARGRGLDRHARLVAVWAEAGIEPAHADGVDRDQGRELLAL